MIWTSLISSFLTFGAMRAAYAAMENSWPASYITTGTKLGQMGRYSLPYYILFRVAPITLITGVSGVLTERAKGSALTSISLAFLLYLLFTFYVTWKNTRKRSNRLKRLLLAAFNLSLGAVGATIGYCLHDLAAPAIPELTDLINSAWSGAFCTILFFAASRMLENKESWPELRERARQEVGQKELTHTKTACNKRGIPYKAVEAILMAEALQRPRWIRMLERAIQPTLRGPLRQNWSTGVAQISSPKPLSDTESIDLLCDDLTNWKLLTGLDIEKNFEFYLKKHNPDEVFIESATEMFYY